MVDLFATQRNTKLPVFFSRHREPESRWMNALTENWDSLFRYTYSGRSISGSDPGDSVCWFSQIWFHPLTKMLVDLPNLSVEDHLAMGINPFTFRVPTESIVCYFYTFENNLRIKGMFAKYLNESCFVASD